METEDLLSSTQSDSRTGPSKRTYRLTDRGRRCLSRWLDSLVAYQEMLKDLVRRAKETVDVGDRL